MFSADLHTKTVLVDALAKMIQATPAESSDASSASHGLLQPMSSPDESARNLIRVKPLEMYLATWLMEPDIDTEIVQATSHLFEVQLAGK